MNIQQSLISRVEHRLTETKNPCKSYATYERCEKVMEQVSVEIGEYYLTSRPARYLIVYIESMGRYIGAFDMNEMFQRHDCAGGYAGIACDAGFYTF